MSAAVSLAPEWRRLELLAACVRSGRAGNSIAGELQEELRQAQEQVLGLRRTLPWKPLTAWLAPLDQDILSCAVAPEAEPRLGWAYQELQPGAPSPYPTSALVRELLFLDADDLGAFRARLAETAPLRRRGLIEPVADLYQPLRITRRTRELLLGWAGAAAPPPGAIELPVRAGWDDLVLPASCRRALGELATWVGHRERVERDWGVRQSGGPIALFSGPSGTGKTFAAEVLAGALGYRLLQVDLGLLVSKYVGETERNLSALLDASADQAILLLFDEADSLFGRRGEVRDARDRWANLEVSHLLSRIELHRGPCVLTTNLRQNLDSAFLRRFHAVLEFPRPDAAARAELWRRHLPASAPLAGDVDPGMLAGAVALSGAQIRNIALRAALLAAAEGPPIGLSHLARAAWAELAKEGREIAPSMVGALASHLPEEVA